MRLLGRLRLLLLLLLLLAALAAAAGCAGSDAPRATPKKPSTSPPTTSPPATPPRPAPEAPGQTASAAPLELPPPEGKPAPWLDTRPPKKRDAIGVAGEVRLGAAAALVRTHAGWYFLHQDQGALGPLELPSGVAWVGLDAKDKVLAATRGGELRVASAKAALPGGDGFRRRGAVPGAAAWDAAGDVVAAGASWDEVFVSKDGGRQFDKASVGEGLRVIEVLARADGAVVARARSLTDPDAPLVTFSARGGRKLRFERARFQPEEQLFRTGAWIWARPDCPAVLAADGVHWISRDVYALAEKNLWAEMLDRTHQVRALPPMDLLSARRPPAPRYDRKRDGPGEGACPAREGEVGGVEGGILGSLRSRDCSDFSCLRSSWPQALGYRSMIALLSDGRCAQKAAAGPGRWCGPGAEHARPPHAVRRDDPRPFDLPEGCEPVRVLAGPGLPLLLCAEDAGTRIYSLDPRNQWHREVALAAAPEELGGLQSAGDGTLALGVSCADGKTPCRVFCRRPLPAGENGAWREVRADGALTYRVAGGGRILSFARAPGGRIEVALHPPDAAPEVLADAAEVPGDASAIRLERRRVLFISGNLLEPVNYLLAEDGSLLPAPLIQGIGIRRLAE